MSKFNEIIAKDNKSVFVNYNEFATEHVIDDDSVLIVMDSDINKERVLGNSARLDDGTYLQHIAFFVEESVLGYRPIENQHIRFDGAPGVVASCDEEVGLLYVVIELNMS